jgi:hypothetical protein
MADVKPHDVTLIVGIGNLAGPARSPTAITLTQPGGATADGKVSLTAPWIRAQADVIVRGTPGDDVGLWRFGFIQLKFITDEWAHYRGATVADGSVFFAADRPPARPQQLCRDSLSAGGIIEAFQRFPFVGPVVFYDLGKPLTNLMGGLRMTGVLPLGTTIPAAGALQLRIGFSDSPDRNHPLVRHNTKFHPARRNVLYSLQTGAAYATMFAVQKGLVLFCQSP